MKDNKTLNIDGRDFEIEGEKNLLEVIRKAKIELPTFCYHSELSVYGACRLCMVDVEGRGIQPACSTPPEKGMKLKTNTQEIRNMRKIIVELLLANEGHDCTVCSKSGKCKLQDLAHKVGIKEIRFKKTSNPQPLDVSTYSLVRDPNKCVLCGDCVRMCAEVQGIGAIDFANRGSKSAVLPCFGKDLGSVECVYCGQCARVCPTGAIMPKFETAKVWKEIENPKKTVVAQIAPAVRVALGEEFGLAPGTTTTGQIVAALKLMGFDMVFDTAFAADLTVIEEGNELIERKMSGKKLPIFTSCCPGWVKFAEQYYPGLTDNLSTCKSPQQMFGSLLKELLPEKSQLKKEDITVVAIMPCTAKKYEAKRDEFTKDTIAEVDYVLTTQELAAMIDEAGIQFKDLEPESFDMPFGFKTGAGVIFGNSGGVSEAVLRYAAEKLGGAKTENYEFKQVRGDKSFRETTITVNGTEIKMAIVSGLKNARDLAEKVQNGTVKYDVIEVMACPGGCIGGAGQPVYSGNDVKKKRTEGIYNNDRMLQLHKSQENPYITELYTTIFGGEHGTHRAHELLHTHYRNHRRIIKESFDISKPKDAKAELNVNVCFGTGCYLRGSQKVMKDILEHLDSNGLNEKVSVKASFCFEKCGRGPVVEIGGTELEACDGAKAIKEIDKCLKIKTAEPVL
jgi:NADH-quinone oxidoreductase subunit G